MYRLPQKGKAAAVISEHGLLRGHAEVRGRDAEQRPCCAEGRLSFGTHSTAVLYSSVGQEAPSRRSDTASAIKHLRHVTAAKMTTR